jgi:hypothetical protein
VTATSTADQARRVRRRSRQRRTAPAVRQGRWAVAAVAAAMAAFAPVAPTGVEPVDRLLAAALAAVVTLASARASRSAWLWLAGIATALAIGSGWAAAAAVALAIALLVVVTDRGGDAPQPWAGAAIGALSVQSLLRAPAIGVFGLPSLVTAVAVAPVLWSAWRSARTLTRRRVGWAVAAAGALALVAVAGLAAATLLARNQVAAATDHARDGLDALRAGDQDTAAALFDSAAREFEEAHDHVAAPWTLPARVVPVVAQQGEALREVTASGRELADAASVAATTAPYRQLRAQSGQIDLDTMRAMQAPVAASADALEQAQLTVEAVRSPWLLAPLTTNLDRFAAEIDRARPEAELADEALQVAPDLLGADQVRHYYIAFATPAEMRFQGGFVGAYGILTAEDGRVTLERSGPIEDLSDAPGAAERTLSGPAVYLERYGRLNPARFPQNLTASPDLPDNAAATAQVVPQAGGPDLDGVIYVDPIGLAALLELTGPITVPGLDQPLTADSAASYLLRDQYLDGRTDDARHDALTEASKATFDALVDRELPSPAEIGQHLAPAVRGGHLLFNPFDAAEQAFFARLGTTGAFLGGAVDAGPTNDPDHRSDWFSVRTSNAGGNKIDSFLRRDVDYAVTVDPATGSVDATATITLHNAAPAGGLPDYVIGNIYGLPRGTNQLYLAFFTPDELRSATLDGQPLGIESQREFAGHVYSALLDLGPGTSATVVLHLTGSVPAAGGDVDYRLAVGHQPLVADDHLTVRVDVAGSTDGSTWAVTGADLVAAGGDRLPVVVDGSSASIDQQPAADLALRVGFHRR